MKNRILKIINGNDGKDKNQVLQQYLKKHVPDNYDLTQVVGFGDNLFLEFSLVNQMGMQGTDRINKSTSYPGVFQDDIRVRVDKAKQKDSTGLEKKNKMKEPATEKQKSYLIQLVNTVQPKDFPGIDSINTKEEAGKWISQLRNKTKSF